jgi:hypothetical protein
LASQLEAINGSRIYRVLRWLRSLLPKGSGREKFGLWVWGILSKVRH